MIISHRNKFIFIKTQKTAGTSIEIALSKYCGPDDIITSIIPGDEIKRKGLGYRGPQNYKIPFTKYSKRDLLVAAYKRKPLSFYNHASASYIMKYVEKGIWDSYFKFCFERNPWDKVVSRYYRRYRSEPRPPITDFVQSREANIIKGFELYTCSSDVVVDKVFLYENLNQALDEIRERINIDEIPSLPHAKARPRKDKGSFRDILTEKDKEKIAKVYAREIAYFYFNFEW